MEDTSENRTTGSYLTLALLAHVDSGKTTLSEGILYLCGKLRKLGRVDHKDAFLDTEELEKDRGITIFSKQAVFDLGEKRVTLLDTPGHVDFAAEMERTLQVLDYGVLVINGADGIQGHTRTLWKLLERYQIPVFLFINKMDQEGTQREALLEELQKGLSEACIAFDRPENPDFLESLAMCEEKALEEYLQTDHLKRKTISKIIRERKVFPCYFGSALKLEGVRELLDGLERYTDGFRRKEEGRGDSRFGARVYKISRDGQGNRLTHMKILSGTLKVKDVLGSDGEKVDQIRIYSGDKFELAQEAGAGMICAVTGLGQTYPGEGLGKEPPAAPPILEPVLSYQIYLPQGCEVSKALADLRRLEEEDPLLRTVWNEELGELHAQVMGEVQIEILKRLIRDRFGLEVEFGAGSIVYKETIQNKVEGVGHFEPLRHYAEVHLVLEPGKPGSGMVYGSDCSEDLLDKNWQRLILTHLEEKRHRGVLIGAELTDVKITLTAGKAHLKHTEGGDFRQATYRAVRQGLMQAQSVLLEPYYEFRLEVPTENLGRALTDIQRMNGEFLPPDAKGEMSVLTGKVPAAGMNGYQIEVAGYTRGRGCLSYVFQGYGPCQDQETVVAAAGYDPLRDTKNPSDSIFCSHGAGFSVPWDQVKEFMHLESTLEKEQKKKEGQDISQEQRRKDRTVAAVAKSEGEEKELEEIFIRTYGKIERKEPPKASRVIAGEERRRRKKEEKLREYLLVDGYNVIFAWEDLKDLAKDNIDGARNRLMDILCNYQGFKKCTAILVFDAYRVEGDVLEIQKYHNIHVVYTKEAETADQYIEKVVHEIGRKYHVTVVTSDGVEQVVTLGQGGTLISAREFREEVELVRQEIHREWETRRDKRKQYLFDSMDEELIDQMEEVRLGKKELK
ncbi:MAG TPA: TetM/TetW/TetO/TetS family tetracycline resistance ribosomal protection protein [Candidatus Dorea gallistercoris]|uniref:TetM/TetW/TetO/TetS family tetracycline resistance ribosomal protection protein n=1 Tax=Candidatus Dorea gallistercoris TaxID=2838542 RepID=A0A9D1RC11_9FIRM|nr:TetM/TetW/TetO/TetS family tetracycline resistance ribosomal protection protein [Candidatus Dorea gallistercoris]